MKSYKLKVGHRSAGDSAGLPAGTICYDCAGYDYGCSSDDTRSTGIEHISVTLDSKGDYPFFTVPIDDLEPA